MRWPWEPKWFEMNGGQYRWAWFPLFDGLINKDGRVVAEVIGTSAYVTWPMVRRVGCFATKRLAKQAIERELAER